MWEIVRVLVAEGPTVLLTTQYLDEADQLADRIAIIDHGRVIAEGTSGELKALVGSGSLHVACSTRSSGPGRAHPRPALGTPFQLESDPAALGPGVRSRTGRRRPRRAGPVLRALAEFSLGQPSLDEVFLALTGPPAEDNTPTEDAAA